MKKITAEDVINSLDLKPLPTEGGYFKQTWCDDYSTVIYYLLTHESWSSLHRLSIAEVWHFYAGDKLKQLQILSNGRAERIEFGSDIASGCKPQLICPAAAWQATRLVTGGEWALVGTTMAPGYTDDCAEFSKPDDLIKDFPEHRKLIKEFS